MESHLRQANKTRVKMGLPPFPDPSPPPRSEEDGPELPFAIAHVWEWFLQAQFPTDSNGYGPRALTFREIDAWAVRTETHTTYQEVLMMRRLSGTYLHHHAEQQKKKEPRP